MLLAQVAVKVNTYGGEGADSSWLEAVDPLWVAGGLLGLVVVAFLAFKLLG